ncbi:Similar to conserved Plasmodium protein, unknown function [Plasmodium falciparum 3D7]; acc. no. XP_001349295 [Pyronema omphalodes CBS 100304]|uniref:Uncharacterized protein n=1 Tax=Pyronema omphalodes (strain CBS 100304) TaxID=1076935 RepID=U4L6G0_PYROM|nr:Similar to conserved Plasmodium protein, unknown function [Plasmodium falciparum 3D7]; acc. no. XP_001349295 [Pyronema omphalodes CBS 100304]
MAPALSLNGLRTNPIPSGFSGLKFPATGFRPTSGSVDINCDGSPEVPTIDVSSGLQKRDAWNPFSACFGGGRKKPEVVVPPAPPPVITEAPVKPSMLQQVNDGINNGAAAIVDAGKNTVNDVGTAAVDATRPYLEIAGSAIHAGKVVGGAVVEAGKIVGRPVIEAGKVVARPVVEAGKVVGNAALDAGKVVGNAALDAGKTVAGHAANAAMEAGKPYIDIAQAGANMVGTGANIVKDTTVGVVSAGVHAARAGATAVKDTVAAGAGAVKNTAGNIVSGGVNTVSSGAGAIKDYAGKVAGFFRPGKPAAQPANPAASADTAATGAAVHNKPTDTKEDPNQYVGVAGLFKEKPDSGLTNGKVAGVAGLFKEKPDTGLTDRKVADAKLPALFTKSKPAKPESGSTEEKVESAGIGELWSNHPALTKKPSAEAPKADDKKVNDQKKPVVMPMIMGGGDRFLQKFNWGPMTDDEIELFGEYVYSDNLVNDKVLYDPEFELGDFNDVDMIMGSDALPSPIVDVECLATPDFDAIRGNLEDLPQPNYDPIVQIESLPPRNFDPIHASIEDLPQPNFDPAPVNIEDLTPPNFDLVPVNVEELAQPNYDPIVNIEEVPQPNFDPMPLNFEDLPAPNFDVMPMNFEELPVPNFDAVPISLQDLPYAVPNFDAVHPVNEIKPMEYYQLGKGNNNNWMDRTQDYNLREWFHERNPPIVEKYDWTDHVDDYGIAGLFE